MAQTVRLSKSLRNAPIKVKAPKPRDTPEHLPAFSQIVAYVGQRGSGKTHSAVNLINAYKTSGAVDRIFIMSPTYESNPQLSVLGADEDDIYTDVDSVISDILDVQAKVIAEGEEWEQFQEDLKIWNAFVKLSRRRDFDPEDLPDDIWERLVSMDFERPQWKYGKEQRPSLILILDDLSHSLLYQPTRSNPFNNMLLRHRHIGKVGINIHMLVQNWKSGIPKFARENLTQLIIYKTHDETALKGLWEQTLQGHLPYEKFRKLFDEATDQPYSFLMVDYNKKKHHPSMFRRNFDEFLVSRENEESK